MLQKGCGKSRQFLASTARPCTINFQPCYAWVWDVRAESGEKPRYYHHLTGFLLVRPIQSQNSTVLGVVAERKIIFAWSGNMMMTSSQTTPRSVSFT